MLRARSVIHYALKTYSICRCHHHHHRRLRAAAAAAAVKRRHILHVCSPSLLRYFIELWLIRKPKYCRRQKQKCCYLKFACIMRLCNNSCSPILTLVFFFTTTQLSYDKCASACLNVRVTQKHKRDQPTLFTVKLGTVIRSQIHVVHISLYMS